MSFTTLVLIVTGLGLYFTLIAFRRARRRRIAASASNGLFALVLFAVAALVALAALNIRTYQRLTHEQLAADLTFTALGAGGFEAALSTPGGKTERLRLEGQEWQLDARIIKWKGFANVMGMDTLYRLERLSGRYRDLAQERSGPRSVHDLSKDSGPDLWALAQRHERWVPWVDAQYGSATYLPMTDGAHYQAFVTQSGLIARPVNQPASQAVQSWP